MPVAEPSGFFRVQQVGRRWVFVTPNGNAFWLIGVFNVESDSAVDDLGGNYGDRIVAKYGDKFKWAEQTVRRLRGWGFNTLAEYSSIYVLPTKSPYWNWSNPVKMPFVQLIRPSSYGLVNKHGYAPGPFKDLIAGTDPAVYTGWRGSSTPDVFDPNFAAYFEGSVKAAHPDVLSSPWVIGWTTDDADDLFGFGPGPEIQAPSLHPHIGWVVLAGSFEQTANQKFGVTYANKKVYAKYALRDFLAAKYGRIQKLNTTWGSAYTTFDSDGGWPLGKGLLDESGRSPWVGDDYRRLNKATPAARADLDTFLYQYARKYFGVAAAAVRKNAPHHLVFGPATLNGWGGLSRKEVLRAAGEIVDVLQAGAGTQKVLALTRQYAGSIPVVSWEGMVANPDSALWRYPNPSESEAAVPVASTQVVRGQVYRDRALALLLSNVSSSGEALVAGFKFWEFKDSWREKRNWGLVTLSDNAYDGREAVVARGIDSWGYQTGGEERSYGDFMTAVRAAHASIMQRLQQELLQRRRPATPSAQP